jgi:Arc/MetJ-type ribon-helix-helix transcriptional regulator
MQQAKFSVAESQIEFIKQYSRFGFKDKSSLVRAALEELRKKLEYQSLKESAELYAEIYQKDNELQKLTNSALLDWPE